MNVQSSINQAISLASLLASQNPAIQAGAEKRAKLKSLGKQEEQISKQLKTIEAPLSRSEEALYEDLMEQQHEINKEKFQVDPSEEALKDYKMSYGATHPISVPGDPEEMAQEMYEIEIGEREDPDPSRQAQKIYEARMKADENARMKQEALRETRRRILEGTPSEYMLGGND